MKYSFRLTLVAIGMTFSLLAYGQDQDRKELLKRKLADMFVLTTGDPSTQEITKAGSIIELRKDGFVMWPTKYWIAPSNLYKEGKFVLPDVALSRARARLKAKDPNLNPENVPKRTCMAGEKFWIIGYDVQDSGIFLEFLSDPYNDTRYKGNRSMGTMWIPVDKNEPMPTVDGLTNELAELISVAPPQAQEAVQPAAAAVLAPIAPPAAPPRW
jgi:hypothetical protein